MTATLVEPAPETAPPASAPRRRRLRRGATTRRMGLILFLLLLGYLVVWPLIKLQTVAFEDGAAGYRVAFGTNGIGSVLFDTFGLALGSTAIAAVLGTLLAWAITRLPRRLQWMRVLPLLPIVMPMVAVVLGWTFLLSPRPGYLNSALRQLPWWSDQESGPIDVYTYPWIVLITGFALTAFVFLFVSTGMQNISADHIEAAQSNGASSTRIFFGVILPLLRPSLIQGTGVAFLMGLGQFTVPLLLGSSSGVDVVATWMLMFTSSSPIDYGAAAALGSPLLIAGLVVIVAQRAAVGNETRFVTHGGKGFRSAGRPSAGAVVLVALYFLISTLLPLLALALVALSPYWSGSPDLTALTLDHIRSVLSDQRMLDAIQTSVITSVAAAVLVLPIGFVAAMVLVRNRENRICRWVLDVLVALPLGVPSVVFGVGFLLAYTAAPLMLYGSRWVMILVYITLMVPFATRTLISGLIALGDSYVAASRSCGANAVQTGFFILLPLMRGSVAGAGAIIFVMLTHEFSASLLVRAPTVQVMGTLLYDFWANGQFPVVATMALVMTVVTGIGVVLAMLVGGRNVIQNL